eukprot:2342161-Pyramimonas_sp.AAC.1
MNSLDQTTLVAGYSVLVGALNSPSRALNSPSRALNSPSRALNSPSRALNSPLLQVNVAPEHLLKSEREGDLLRRVLLHEVTHVLGFDPDAFPFFRDEEGAVRTDVSVTILLNNKPSA